MVKELSQRSAASERLSVLDSAPISRSRDIAMMAAIRHRANPPPPKKTKRRPPAKAKA
jgi:hypothetical protein